MIKKGLWKDSKGRLCNPGKSFLLKLDARVVREVNLEMDSDGLRFARKAMIITGISLNTNGAWGVQQLMHTLQSIMLKHRTGFDASQAIAVDKNQFWVENLETQ